MDKIDAIGASGLVSSAMLAALVSRLRQKDIISEQDEREILEHALLLLERGQAEAPDLAEVYEAARAVIEEQLR